MHGGHIGCTGGMGGTLDAQGAWGGTLDAQGAWGAHWMHRGHIGFMGVSQPYDDLI